RLREKTFLSENGFPVTEFRQVRSSEEATRAAEAMCSRSILKSADDGYEGKGWVCLTDASEAAGAFAKIGRPLCVLEKWVPFDLELSVIVARTSEGQMVSCPPGRNDHVNGILDVTVAPAPISPKLARDAI